MALQKFPSSPPSGHHPNWRLPLCGTDRLTRFWIFCKWKIASGISCSCLGSCRDRRRVHSLLMLWSPRPGFHPGARLQPDLPWFCATDMDASPRTTPASWHPRSGLQGKRTSISLLKLLPWGLSQHANPWRVWEARTPDLPFTDSSQPSPSGLQSSSNTAQLPGKFTAVYRNLSHPAHKKGY